MRVVTLMLAASVAIIAGCSEANKGRPSYVNIGSVVNNREAGLEWQKVSKRLADHHIYTLNQCSLGCVIIVEASKAREARKIIADMVAKGEVDSEKMHLTLTEK